MPQVAIYNQASGLIVNRVTCPYDHIDIQRKDGEDFYLNCPREATHIINQEPVTVPAATSVLLAAIRNRRNTLLAACDWTQVVDAPVNKAAWVAYRQALRDFPETCDPADPQWPTPPI